MRALFDERLEERTRLARDLHDTLLQTIQGSKLVADDALTNHHDGPRTLRALQRLSAWLDRATREGRAALESLRASTPPSLTILPARFVLPLKSAAAIDRWNRWCISPVSPEICIRWSGMRCIG